MPLSKAESIVETSVATAILIIPLGLASGASLTSLRLGLPVVVASLLAIPLFLVLSANIARYRKSEESIFAPVVGTALFTVVLMVPPLLVEVNESVLLSFYHFATGTIFGVVAGVAYSQTGNRWSRIDWAISTVLIIEALIILRQAAASISENGIADGLRILHRTVDLGWGSSNFAAGCLVILSAVLVSRTHAWSRRKLPRIAVALTVAAVFLTTSRGALVALTLALIVFLWNGGSSARQASGMWLRRFALVFVLVGSYAAFEGFNVARSSGGFDPGENIETRFEIYAYAIESFAESPLLGTGWLGMRDMPGVSIPVSFAHNVFLSFPQIGGAFGLIYLLVVISLGVQAFKVAPALRPALLAILAISLTDPILEGFMGSFLAWMVLAAAISPKNVRSIPKQLNGAGHPSVSGPQIR